MEGKFKAISWKLRDKSYMLLFFKYFNETNTSHEPGDNEQLTNTLTSMNMKVFLKKSDMVRELNSM